MPTPSISVLLIEDDEDDALLVEELLAEEGQAHFQMECATRLRDGLDRLQATNYDVVILDLCLPDAEGLEGCHALRDRFPHIPVVVMTGMRNDEVAREALQHGAQDFLVKGDVDVYGVQRCLIYATERKRMESMLVRSERLAAVGTLAAGVAHEFNNINNIIINHLGLALGRETIDPAVRERVHKAMEAVDRGATITRDLLSFSRPEQGANRTDRTPVPVRAMVESVLRMCKSDLNAQRILSRVEGEEALQVLGSPGSLQQVLMNLVINAMHAMDGRARRELTVRIEPAGQRTRVHVADTGSGIEKDRLEAIWTPFYSTKGAFLESANGNPSRSEAASAANRAPTPRTDADGPPIRLERPTTAGGTGLGLTICQRLIQDMGGEIKVASRIEEGSTFTIDLPAHTETRARSAPVEALPVCMGKARILVVEDELDMREIMVTTLRTIVPHVDGAASGLEGLERLRAGRYDLVVTDLQMPDLGGVEMMERAREADPAHAPCCIVVTGRLDAANQADLTRLSPDDVLRKPFPIAELVRRARLVLQRAGTPKSARGAGPVTATAAGAS